MHIRECTYTTIDSLLIMSDLDLDSFTDEEQKIVIKYSYEHIEEFKRSILELIENYERLLNNKDLETHENGLLNACLELDKQLQFINDAINPATQNLLTHSQHIQNIVNQSNVYLFSLLKLNDIITDIKNAQDALIDSKIQLRQMNDRFNNFGIKKIENSLSFFINLILNFPAIKYINKKTSEIYSSLLSSLAEFYYNHGKSLFIIENDPISDLNIYKPDNHIAISLILFMMSGSIKASVLENACYIHLIQKVLNLNLDKIWIKEFDLAYFASASPHEFSKLYYYLNENQLFSKYLNGRCHDNVYLTLKSGLFNLYMSFALKQLAENSLNDFSRIDHESDEMAYRNQAKKMLLHCLKNDMTVVIDIFEKYFSELDISIDLVIYFFKKNDPRSLSASALIYSNISNFTSNELLPYTTNLFHLLKYWLRQNDIQLKNFALEKLKVFILQHYKLAERVLIEYAHENIDGAIFYSDAIIEKHSLSRIAIVKKILNKYLRYNNDQIFFNLYRVDDMLDTPNYPMLFRAAELNNKVAKDQLILLRKQRNSKELENVLIDKLECNSLLAFQILNENCQDSKIELDLAIYALQHKLIDGAFRIKHIYELVESDNGIIKNLDQNKLLTFYDYLIRSTDDHNKMQFAMTKLKSYLRINDYAYNILLYHAMLNYSIAIDLVKFCMMGHPNYKRLKELKELLLFYHNDNLSSEGKYYLYLIDKTINRHIKLDLLNEVFKFNNELAMREFIFLYCQINAQKTYTIWLNNSVININHAILYFENELAEYALKKGRDQYVVAEMISFHYIRQAEFLKSEMYIRICLELNPDETFNKISIDHRLDCFSDSFKNFYLEKKKIFVNGYNPDAKKPVSDSIKYTLMLFHNDKAIAHRLEDEKFELKKIIASANIPNELRVNFLENMQKVRNGDDLSRIKSQLLEYNNEPVKLSK